MLKISQFYVILPTLSGPYRYIIQAFLMLFLYICSCLCYLRCFDETSKSSSHLSLQCNFILNTYNSALLDLENQLEISFVAQWKPCTLMWFADMSITIDFTLVVGITWLNPFTMASCQHIVSNSDFPSVYNFISYSPWLKWKTVILVY